MSIYILKQFSKLVEFLGHALGPDYEIILRDLTQDGGPIIAMSNSNRSVSSPMTDLSAQLIANNDSFKQDYIYNINSKNSEGYTRGATLLIRDENDNIIGMLGIQFNDSKYMEIIENILDTIHPKNFNHRYKINPSFTLANESKTQNNTEIFMDDPEILMESIYKKTINNLKIDVDEKTSSDNRIIIVSSLQSNGLFQIKGAVKFVADKLNVSAASVYRYLGEL